MYPPRRNQQSYPVKTMSPGEVAIDKIRRRSRSGFGVENFGFGGTTSITSRLASCAFQPPRPQIVCGTTADRTSERNTFLLDFITLLSPPNSPVVTKFNKLLIRHLPIASFCRPIRSVGRLGVTSPKSSVVDIPCRQTHRVPRSSRIAIRILYLFPSPRFWKKVSCPLLVLLRIPECDRRLAEEDFAEFLTAKTFCQIKWPTRSSEHLIA